MGNLSDIDSRCVYEGGGGMEYTGVAVRCQGFAAWGAMVAEAPVAIRLVFIAAAGLTGSGSGFSFRADGLAAAALV